MGVDDAAAELNDSAAASRTELADLLDDLHASVSTGERSVGAALDGSDNTIRLISQWCGHNQTPISVAAEFGG